MILDEENRQVLRLVQALVGSVSSNLRRVGVEVQEGPRIRISFLFEQDVPDPRDDVEEVMFAFEAQQEGYVDVDVSVLVDSRPIEQISRSSPPTGPA